MCIAVYVYIILLHSNYIKYANAMIRQWRNCFQMKTVCCELLTEINVEMHDIYEQCIYCWLGGTYCVIHCYDANSNMCVFIIFWYFFIKYVCVKMLPEEIGITQHICLFVYLFICLFVLCLFVYCCLLFVCSGGGQTTKATSTTEALW